jgi:RHS repeat-associated protein
MKRLAVSLEVSMAVVMLITAVPKAPAQSCWTPVVGWTGSYTLVGNGTGQFAKYTVTVNEQYKGQVQLNLAQTECSSLSYGGSLPTSSGSINDTIVNSCSSGGSAIQTWVAPPGPGQNAGATLSIDLSNGTYIFTATAPLLGKVTAQKCDGSTTTATSLMGGDPDPIPPWPPSFTLPATPQELKEQNFQFNAAGGPLPTVVPWTLNFTLDPKYYVDNGCNAKGGSNISCQNQSLGEDVPIAGTGFNLHYEGDRAPGAGANSVPSADAFMIGGWTLSVHHAYDRTSNTLFLGDGSQRNGYRLGTPLSFNGKNLLTSEDGSEVYVFDGSTGRHLQTLKPMTGALEYQFGYDAAGNLVTVTDSSGNVTTIQRDASERATAIVSPYGQTTNLGLDSNGFLSRITDPLGKSVTFANSSKGLLTTLVDAKGNVYNYTYDGQGRLAKDADPAGGYTTLSRTNGVSGFTWNVTLATAMGQTSSFQTTLNLPWVQTSTSTFSEQFTNTEPCGVTATYSETHAADGFLASNSLPDGTSYNTTFGADQRWGIQVPVPTSTTLSFGSLIAKTSHKRTPSLGTPGNPFSLTTQTDTETVNGRVYTSSFRASTRTYTNTTPLGRQQLVTLDAKERVTSTQLGGLLPTNLSYDGRGRLASVRQGTRSEVFTYDANGYLASVTDPLGLKTTFTNDAVGHRLATTLADGRIIRYAYDANGNLVGVTPPGKSAHDFSFTAVNLPSSYTPPVVPGTGATRYSYDADRRISVITRSDGGTVKYSYDHAGRISSLATPTATLNYANSATTCNLISAAISGGEQLTYGYDGPLLTIKSWIGTVAGHVSRVYNNNFWIASQSMDGGATVAFNYDNDGLLNKAGELTLTRAAANGLITGTTLSLATDARTYDLYGELTGYTASYKGTPIYSFDLIRDNSGRITKKSETIGGQTTTYGYDYDASGRLVSVLHNGSIARSYTYDSNSNRLITTAGTVTTKGTYDAQDRLLGDGFGSYTYTANGELASRSVGGSKTTYQYDVFGNLLGATLANGKKISYVIDPQNRRIGKKVNGTLTAGFLYDNDRLVAQLNAGNFIESQFIYASEESVPDYMVAGGVTYRIFSDHLGSPRLVVNVLTGRIAERIDYDEFGNVITDTNPGFQPFGFAGGLYDQDTKLLRFGARDYEPSAGRWTTKDPILFAGGDTNLYRYVFNDPVNMTDPGGLGCPTKEEIKDWLKKQLEKKLCLGPVCFGQGGKPEASVKASVDVQADGKTVVSVSGEAAVGVNTTAPPLPSGYVDASKVGYVDVSGGVNVPVLSKVPGLGKLLGKLFHHHEEINVENYHGESTQTRAATACDPECH